MMDTLNFDGSCTPNPGGRLGFGWVLTLVDGVETSGSGERAPALGNTNNVAEYLGLIAGLSAYLDAGGRGPLAIVGDSQLIIGQISGAMAVKNAALMRLRDEARHLIARIPRGVSYRWERREQNTAADALAGDGTSSLPAPSERSYAQGVKVQTAPISAAVRAAIVRLNEHPAPGFKDFARLAVGGADVLSGRKLPQLLIESGPQVAAAVQAAFPDDPARQAAVLRWCLRGLAVELAIRKGQVDHELARRSAR